MDSTGPKKNSLGSIECYGSTCIHWRQFDSHVLPWSTCCFGPLLALLDSIEFACATQDYSTRLPQGSIVGVYLAALAAMWLHYNWLMWSPLYSTGLHWTHCLQWGGDTSPIGNFTVLSWSGGGSMWLLLALMDSSGHLWSSHGGTIEFLWLLMALMNSLCFPGLPVTACCSMYSSKKTLLPFNYLSI